jgi:spore germination protein
LNLSPPESRNNFTALIRELKTALGPNLTLHLNAHPKTADLPTNRIVGAFDYAALGRIVDRIAIMTIEHGYSAGPPNPNAPIWWVEEVIRYATRLIDRRKMMIALPFYGYDWPIPTPPGTTAATASVEELQNRAIQNQAPIIYDTTAQEPTYSYSRNGQQHKVWFQDPRSLEAKYALVEIYNLLGVTFWHLNNQFPQNWAYMSKNFRVIRHP